MMIRRHLKIGTHDYFLTYHFKVFLLFFLNQNVSSSQTKKTSNRRNLNYIFYIIFVRLSLFNYYFLYLGIMDRNVRKDINQQKYYIKLVQKTCYDKRKRIKNCSKNRRSFLFAFIQLQNSFLMRLQAYRFHHHLTG